MPLGSDQAKPPDDKAAVEEELALFKHACRTIKKCLDDTVQDLNDARQELRTTKREMKEMSLQLTESRQECTALTMMLGERNVEQRDMQRAYNVVATREKKLSAELKHARLESATKLAETMKELADEARKNYKIRELLHEAMKLTA